MTEARACYRKGGRRELEPQWDSRQEPDALYSKRAKQFGAFQALRGYEEMLDAVRSEHECTTEKNNF
ncbi:MAG: hypothetical protein ACI3WS_00315 [Phascolarctobacterium sp.]